MRGWGALLTLALTIGLAASPEPTHAQGTLNVATWGGAYGQSQEVAFFEPFAKETGISISTELYNGKFSKLKAMIGEGSVDVVDVSSDALETLCKDGLLETIDASSLSAASDGRDTKEDFLPGAISSCGVASVAWSTAVAFDRKAFPKGAPTNISALLDTAKFPGKRALPRNPRYSLELALLADGVPAGDIYSTLETPEGADRAFAALDKIKDDVLLWQNAAEPMTWLIEGKVAMAAGYSGRIFRAAVGDSNIGVLWDGQVYDFDAWAIPKSSDNKKAARRFVGFATAPARLAEQAELIAYGPMRKSALALIGKHPVLAVDMQAYVPTAPQNFADALRFDAGWWRENGAALKTRFSAWQAEVDAAEAARKAAQKAKEAAEEKPAGAAP